MNLELLDKNGIKYFLFHLTKREFIADSLRIKEKNKLFEKFTYLLLYIYEVMLYDKLVNFEVKLEGEKTLLVYNHKNTILLGMLVNTDQYSFVTKNIDNILNPKSDKK